MAENIQFLESRGASQQRGPSGYGPNEAFQHQAPPSHHKFTANGRKTANPFQNDGEQIDISDDDLPF